MYFSYVAGRGQTLRQLPVLLRSIVSCYIRSGAAKYSIQGAGIRGSKLTQYSAMATLKQPLFFKCKNFKVYTKNNNKKFYFEVQSSTKENDSKLKIKEFITVGSNGL